MRNKFHASKLESFRIFLENVYMCVVCVCAVKPEQTRERSNENHQMLMKACYVHEKHSKKEEVKKRRKK